MRFLIQISIDFQNFHLYLPSEGSAYRVIDVIPIFIYPLLFDERLINVAKRILAFCGEYEKMESVFVVSDSLFVQRARGND